MRESQAQLCGTWKICVDDERGCVSLAESAKKQKIRIECFVCCDINARPSTPMTKQNHFNWMWCYCLCFVVSVRIEKTSRVQRQVNRTINENRRSTKVIIFHVMCVHLWRLCDKTLFHAQLSIVFFVVAVKLQKFATTDEMRNTWCNSNYLNITLSTWDRRYRFITRLEFVDVVACCCFLLLFLSLFLLFSRKLLVLYVLVFVTSEKKAKKITKK